MCKGRIVITVENGRVVEVFAPTSDYDVEIIDLTKPPKKLYKTRLDELEALEDRMIAESSRWKAIESLALCHRTE